MNAAEIRAWLIDRIAGSTGLDPATIRVSDPFESFGLSSRDAVSLSGDLEDLLGRTLPATLLYEYPSIAALSDHLGTAPSRSAGISPSVHSAAPDQAVAIVGMACRFPGADGPDAFWRLLRNGTDMIREVPADRWDVEAVFDADPAVPGKSVSRWGGFLDQVDRFDAFFFGISPGEAERMDPQQRLLLELAWEACEDAGVPAPRLAGSQAGVFVGVSVNEYSFLQASQPDRITGHSGTGNALSIAANRISYFLDLRGPSLAVDTACSSSLTAIHLACRSLRAGECDLAIAGGVNIVLGPAHSIAFTKAGVLAPDGRCKTFDARADGYVRGEGAGLVVLKPLARALADGDTIHAVIRGSALRQDGRTNGLMAPNREAQVAVLEAACRDAGVSPGAIQYVEAHGTGTLLGDAIEAGALGAVLSRGRTGPPCAIGSVKSNIGHLEAAAGVAGLIKVVLALKHRELPPTLHCVTPNPHVPFDALGLRVQTALGTWADPAAALAGVSSFGFGGTNVHMIVSAAPDLPVPAAPPHREPEPLLLPVSARTPEALAALGRSYRALLASPDLSPADLCASASLRRSHLDQRVAFLGDSASTLAEAIDAFLQGTPHPGVLQGNGATSDHRGPVFVFSGQGGQWPGMGRELLESEPVAREALMRCDALLRDRVSWSLLEVLRGDDRTGLLDNIDVVQPALFAMQVAQAALWRSWGIEPVAVVGHSMGEVAAACVAGVLTLEEAVDIIVARSRLLKRLSGAGGMAIVGLSATETTALLERTGTGAALAGSNSPRATVVSGTSGDLARLIAILEHEGIYGSLVNVDVPSHGPLTWPLRDPLRQQLEHVRPRPGTVPVVSTVSGGPSPGTALTAEYWARNLSEPVRFAEAVESLAAAGHRLFLEVGPHPVLAHSIQQGLAHHGMSGAVLASLRRDEPARFGMRRAWGELYASGLSLDWRRVHPPPRHPVALTPYPWERVRYWIEAGAPGQSRARGRSARSHPLLGERTDVAGPGGMRVWQAEVAPEETGFLRDHRVNGVVVLPFAAHVDLILSAVHDAGLPVSTEVLDLVVDHPIVFDGDKPRALQIVLTPAEGGRTSVEIFARAASDRAWTRHASASLRAEAETVSAPVAVVDLEQRCPEALSPEELYRLLGARGLQYGPALRRVETIRRGPGEALGRIALGGGPSEVHRVHPALLDGALQLIAAAALGVPAVADGDTWVPTGCRRITALARPGSTVWGHVEVTADPSAETLEATIRLLDDRGTAVVELAGLRLARLRREAGVGAAAADGATLYAIRWREDPWPAPSAGMSSEGGRRWVVLGDPDGMGNALARRLRMAGHDVDLLTTPGAAAGALGTITVPLHGVVCLWGAAPEAGTLSLETLRSAQQAGVEAILGLVQTLVASSGRIGAPRLWLVTRGIQTVASGESPAVSGAPIWGLAKTLTFEFPDFRCTALDLDSGTDAEGLAEVLYRQVSLDDEEDQVAIRGGRRFVPRLRLHEVMNREGSCPFAAPDRFLPDAMYLIAGGLGGLGFAVAEWMVERGARHLALVGRGGPSPRVEQAIAALRAQGAVVEAWQADITRPDEVARVMATVRGTGLALRGVVHAAGVLDNAALADLDVNRLRRVMAARVDGAWNLHTGTAGAPLDFFVLFSSAVSVLGSPGQGNYAAAASFMDALARFRHGLGLPGLSINWGPWAEVGMVAGGVKAPGPSGSSGVKALEPGVALETLGRLLRDGGPQVTVLPFDLESLLALYPSAARIPFFREVGGRDTHVAKLYARPNLRQAFVAPRNEVERQLAALWRQALRIDRVGVYDSFFELGGDSVLAAQVVTAAHRVFGVTLDLRQAFEAFTIDHLARRVAEALDAGEVPSPPIDDTAREVPLSFIQERQLFLELLDPMTAVNNLSLCLQVDGPLDVAALRRAANAILGRHQVLRSSFAIDQGRPAATVATALSVEVPVEDIPGGRDAIDEVLRQAEREAATPFDLATPPLLRFRIFRLSADRHLLLVVVHHTISDGWSLGVFLQELFALYRGETLPPLPMQYADFAAGQRRAVEEPGLQAQLKYWKERLAGELPVLDLATDRPRAARQTFTGATHRFRIPAALADGIRRISRSVDATLFMALVAGFKAVLHRHTGQDDLLVGTAIAGRLRPETAGLIGPFINTLVLRTDLSGEPGFTTLVRRVREAALGAYANQDLPFERLVAELRPPRDLSRTPVFQVMCIQQTPVLASLATPGLTLRQLPLDRGASQFDLTLTVTELDGGVEAVFEYNTDLFDGATVTGLGEALMQLLEDAIARPDEPVSSLAVMSSATRDRLVREFNRTAERYPEDQCIHQLFAAQVARTPAQVAVMCGQDAVTYEVLDAWANQLADGLRRHGVGPDLRVAVQLNRSIELVASLLAVLKAGGAYVPVDAGCPADRLEFMLRDADVRVLLSRRSAPAGSVPVLVPGDRPEGTAVAAWRAAALEDRASARQLANVIYTSGSTGKPKGVLIEHRSVVNLLWAMRAVAGIGAGDRLLAVTSIAFDIAGLEIFLPLLVGGTVVVAPETMTRDGAALAAALEAFGVSAMQATPATWRMLINSGWKGRRGLVALCGGEALAPALADALCVRTGALWNVYGPTETTIWSTAGRMVRGQAQVTVGRPLANTRLYLLDRHRQPVPPGAVGELAIAGDGVARGYLNRPGLTEAAFLTDVVIDGEREARVFLTGDRARYLPDGTVVLLGRGDDQVKVNGYRIELGEIEAALARHPAIRDAVVTVRAGVEGVPVLTAHYVPADPPPDGMSALRDYLRSVLPAYMVPAVYVPLERLPLTTSGKVDRKALPAPPATQQDGGRSPQTPLEATLASIYAGVLGLEQVGVEDNFFDLGGGSLQIIEIIARCRPHGLALVPELFFEYQTIAALAPHVAQTGEAGALAGAPA